jgi:hypothetical protein
MQPPLPSNNGDSNTSAASGADALHRAETSAGNSSNPYASTSHPSSATDGPTVGDISIPDELPVWLANPETQSAILEMLDEEVSAAINPNYMEFHSDAVMPDGLCITPAMRLMTINWMSEAIYALDLDQV